MSVGEFFASSGAASTAPTMAEKRTMPKHDFGFVSRSRSQPGRRTRRRRREEGRARGPTTAASAGSPSGKESSVGAIPTSGGPDPWIEDDVEDVHDEVRGEHADREEEEQGLRQRVVRAERRLLKRQPGAWIAEHVLDEDQAADG